MRNKPPLLGGRSPDKEYNLDSDDHLAKLGLTFEQGKQIADSYSHYPTCQFAVIEYKSSTLRKAIKQIEDTIKRLVTLGHRVDFPIIVANKLNRYEKSLFFRNPKTKILCHSQTKKPFLIKVGSHSLNVILYYKNEVNRMYGGLRRYIKRRGHK